jgi:translation elongation factor EF-Ts
LGSRFRLKGGERVAEKQAKKQVKKQTNKTPADLAVKESIDELMKIRRERVLSERQKEVLDGYRLTAGQMKELSKVKTDLMLADIAPMALEREFLLLSSDEASPELQHKVAESLLNRSFGKPTQTVESNVGGTVKITLSPELEEYSK